MGIYLQSFAKRGWLPSSNLPEKLSQAAREWAQATGLGDLLVAGSDSSSAQISIYPPAGLVVFQVNRDRVSFGTKTSIAGPGYHAALLDLCDWLQQKLDLKWQWDADGDSSGYARTRNRMALEAAFVDQLRATFKHLAKVVQPGGSAAMNLHIGLGYSEPGKIATPMGWIEPPTVAHLAETSDEELSSFAAQFYPWWRENDGALFWTNTLRCLLWADAVWRQPASQWEQHVHNVISAAHDRIVRGYGTVPPDLGKAIEELRSSQRSNNPVEGVIGYRRKPTRFELGGPWFVVAPGHYQETLENEGKCFCVWTPGEELRATSFSFKPGPSQQLGWPGILKDEPEYQAYAFAYRISTEVKADLNSDYRSVVSECVAQDSNGHRHILLLTLTTQATRDAALSKLRRYLEDDIHFQPTAAPNETLDA